MDSVAGFSACCIWTLFRSDCGESYASGTSDELRFTPAGTFHVTPGGQQRLAAGYLEDLFLVSPSVSITAGLRTDWWRNEGEGLRVTEGQLNPRLAVLWAWCPAVALESS